MENCFLTVGVIHRGAWGSCQSSKAMKKLILQFQCRLNAFNRNSELDRLHALYLHYYNKENRMM